MKLNINVELFIVVRAKLSNSFRSLSTTLKHNLSPLSPVETHQSKEGPEGHYHPASLDGID